MKIESESSTRTREKTGVRRGLSEAEGTGEGRGRVIVSDEMRDCKTNTSTTSLLPRRKMESSSPCLRVSVVGNCHREPVVPVIAISQTLCDRLESEGDSVAGYDSRRAESQGSRPLPALGSGTAPKTHRHH